MSRRHPDDPPGYNYRLAAERAAKRPQVCSVDACNKPTKGGARGWCAMHYARWKAHGNPVKMVRPTYGENRIIKGGYVYIYEPSHPLAHSHGYVAEHRKVVHDAGIRIPPGYHVHHEDHDKTNNALSNLIVVSNSDHHAEHHQLGDPVTNQYGTFVVHRAKARRQFRRAS